MAHGRCDGFTFANPYLMLSWATLSGRGATRKIRERIFYACCLFLALAVWGCAQQDMPTALRDDIHVEHFMKVGPESVRIARDPLSGNLHYVTFGGDVFEITLP